VDGLSCVVGRCGGTYTCSSTWVVSRLRLIMVPVEAFLCGLTLASERYLWKTGPSDRSRGPSLRLYDKLTPLRCRQNLHHGHENIPPRSLGDLTCSRSILRSVADSDRNLCQEESAIFGQ
jgi:hypothetical protein